MTSSALTLVGLSKEYKSFTLGPVDFEVQRGTVVSLIGTNGSGKSTLFHTIMGIVQPEKGTVQVFGEDYKKNEVAWKQKVGYVGEQYGTLAYLTVKEIAAFVSRWYPSWDQHKYLGLLKRYQIDENKKFNKSSKGTRRKIEFILAMSHSPELLLLDEPSEGVDIVSQRKMKEDLLEYMNNENHTIVIATHILDEVRQISDYICVLDQGKIVTAFEKDEIYEKWARLWVSDLTDTVRNHQHTLDVTHPPLQLVTDNVESTEALLEQEGIQVTHRQSLSLDEVITFILEAASHSKE